MLENVLNIGVTLRQNCKFSTQISTWGSLTSTVIFKEELSDFSNLLNWKF